MLYTRKGDKGTTKVFDSAKDGRISKADVQIEALGSLDELNSFLGLVKVKIAEVSFTVNGRRPADIIEKIQNDLFILQAELAGSEKKTTIEMVSDLEEMIEHVEKELPPIKTFFISGGTELSALLDISRTLSRKAERRIVAFVDKTGSMKGSEIVAYSNRLSSLFYAMTRLSNLKSGINDDLNFVASLFFLELDHWQFESFLNQPRVQFFHVDSNIIGEEVIFDSGPEDFGGFKISKCQ